MTDLVDRLPDHSSPVHGTPRHVRAPRPARRWRLVALAVLLVAVVATVAAVVVGRHVRDQDLHREYLDGAGWPRVGQAAYRVEGVTQASPGQRPVPIASVAKVMTAYLVLQAHPLARDADGPALPVTATDVADYENRRADGQSVTAVRAGVSLSERQALLALLLPSANNVAALLARFVAGSVPEFVARMNAAARRLGMTATRYTDPSGYADTTVSTARDQLVLAAALAGSETFTALAATESARLPVAGLVHNTDTLLSREGFVGTKTGSDDAAGGCFLFRTYRLVRGQITDVLGVVLGQRGRHDITAGLQAARQLAARIGPAAGV